MTFQEWLEDRHADSKSTVWKSNADALQQAYTAGRASVRDQCVDVWKTEFEQQHYQRGRESMREEVFNVCADWRTDCPLHVADAIRSIK